jgi:hypothetical protein
VWYAVALVVCCFFAVFLLLFGFVRVKMSWSIDDQEQSSSTLIRILLRIRIVNVERSPRAPEYQ